MGETIGLFDLRKYQGGIQCYKDLGKFDSVVLLGVEGFHKDATFSTRLLGAQRNIYGANATVRVRARKNREQYFLIKDIPFNPSIKDRVEGKVVERW